MFLHMKSSSLCYLFILAVYTMLFIKICQQIKWQLFQDLDMIETSICSSIWRAVKDEQWNNGVLFGPERGRGARKYLQIFNQKVYEIFT